ncbi:MAG TPA: potassium channel family protein [Bacillales bacterium]|nr:potassium channel family protein [Bacillales bacterium]
MPRKTKMLYNIAVLFMLYLNIILSFAVIYMILDYTDIGPIVDHYRTHVKAKTWFDPLLKPLYFSAITLLSVGYGDLTPFGLSRIISVFEAMIGYILPATVAVQAVRFFPAILNPDRDTNQDD